MDKRKIINSIDDQLFNISEIDLKLRQLIYELENDYHETKKIRNLPKFIRKLKEENLYTKELEEFIEKYIKYDNGDDE